MRRTVAVSTDMFAPGCKLRGRPRQTSTLSPIFGTITRVLWINPHTFWYVDTKGADGNLKHWQVEGPSPAEWRNAKVTRDLAGKPGDNITIEVIVGKTMPDRALGHKFTFPDGHVIQLKMNEAEGTTVATPVK